MKKILAFVFVLVLGGLIVNHLSENDLFTGFGEAVLNNRVSESYINRDVTGQEDEIIFGESADLESGAANTVTAIVADYRSFDTLGEVTVLFVSALGVALLLGQSKKRIGFEFRPNFMLKIGSRALFAIILMTGVSVIIHGHLTPGGGFPGGVMIASSMLLLYLADDEFRAKMRGFKILESTMGVLYILLGVIGLLVTGAFLENFIGNGTLGALFSAGMIPIVYIIIGLKVGSEISSVIDHFLSEEGA
jgi:multicomponent Na+:H+ antiporter subunit B